MNPMSRYIAARDYVYTKFNQIYNENFRQAAFIHVVGVDTMAALIASSRNLNVELAKIAAVFHDYSSFVENVPHDDHAFKSMLACQQWMKESNLFEPEEIDEVCFAIEQHSRKQTFDSPLAECLKDADIMAHFTENPCYPYGGIKKQRIMDAMSDIKNHTFLDDDN
jgi:HD superfamily phosphodiesterase